MLGVCLAATAVLWLAALRNLDARAAQRIERAAAQGSAALAAHVRNYEDLARAAAGFYAGSEEVTPDEFRVFVEQLGVAHRDPAFVSLAFVAGDTGSVRLLEPPAAGGTAAGLDAGANLRSRAGLDAARDEAEARLEAPIPLASFPDDRGAALHAPVFVPSPRGREFRGWMSITFRFRPLMADVLAGADPEITVALYDGTTLEDALFTLPGGTGSWPSPVRRPMTLAGHPLTLVFAPRPTFRSSVGVVRPPATAIVGVLLSGLLFGLVRVLATTRRRALALAEDITRSLRESELRYEVLFEQNVAGIFRSTVGGRLLECNEAFARIFGYASRREMLDDSAVSVYERPEDRQRFLQELIQKGTLLNHEQRYRRKDGTPVWTLEYVTLRAGEGTIEGTIVDVSDVKRAEEALRRSEERYRNVFQQFRDGILFIDLATRRVLDSNLAIHKLLGYTAGEMLELTLYDFVLDERQAIDANVARAGAESFVHIGERRYRRKDGGVVGVDVESFRFDEDGASVIFVLVRNLADRRLLEDQLRQAQKMEAVGRLAGGVAHDFNNLLTAIVGYSDLILMGEPPEDVRQNVEEVRKAADRAAALTRQLLAFSRKQVLQPRILELNDVVKNLDGMLHRVLRENVRIEFEPDPHLWRVKADPGQIEQVLMNLAVNASDAMPEGGTLRIGTRNRTLASGDVQEIPVPPGAYVLLEVADTGHGMDAATLAHVFEPFFTTKERGKGTGLGLATAYGIVKQSGGYIQVLSEPGKGATFRIYLPRVHGAADSPSNVSPKPSPLRGSETILLVEDEEGVRRLARTVLRARGYQVLEAETAEAALELARGHRDQIDLLLTDVVLPGMDGHRLAEALRSERPGLAVLLSSGYFDTREGVGEGDPLLRKPFTPDGLIEAVRSVLSKGSRKGRRRAPPP